MERKEFLFVFTGLFLILHLSGCIEDTKNSSQLSEQEIEELKSLIQELEANQTRLQLEVAELKKQTKYPEMAGPIETIGGFKITSEDICRVNEKPVFYVFGSSTCPHCQWEKSIIEEFSEKYGDYVIFRTYQLDKVEPPEEDYSIYQKYNEGGIPLIVAGCKYFRTGSGETIGKENEKAVIKAIICDITDNAPPECRP